MMVDGAVSAADQAGGAPPWPRRRPSSLHWDRDESGCTSTGNFLTPTRIGLLALAGKSTIIL